VVDRLGERRFMVGGLTLQALGMGWVALIADSGLTYSEFLIPSIVAGVGVSMAIPSAQNSVVGSFGLEEVGKAAGANSMMRELGGVFGVAVAAAVFAGAGSFASADAFLDGFAPAIAVVAALSLAGAIVAIALPGRRQAGKTAPVGAVALEAEGKADHTPITIPGGHPDETGNGSL
jgi:MFS family permease